MTITVSAKFIRIAPRKTRLVVDLVRGRSVTDAEHQLLFSNKDAAKVVLKLLRSAKANAVHNYQLDPIKMKIAKAFVNEGPKIHRMTPKAHGSATPIRKRMSHITLVLDEMESAKMPDATISKTPRARNARAVKEVKN
ncbi:MAG: 50S ribosomal protein L22 [Patescibacteria group bacterium]